MHPTLSLIFSRFLVILESERWQGSRSGGKVKRDKEEEKFHLKYEN